MAARDRFDPELGSGEIITGNAERLHLRRQNATYPFSVSSIG